MKDYSSETALKFTRSSLDRHVGRCVGRRAHPLQEATLHPLLSLPKPRSVPIRNTVSTCESISTNTRISLQLLSFNTINYYTYLVHAYFKANAAEKLKFMFFG